jgi:hypothetical protein
MVNYLSPDVLKDLIIIRGRNHYPQDIEWTVENCHEAIRRNCSAAFSITVEDEEQLVVTAEVERRFRRPFQAPKETIADQEDHRFHPDRRQPDVIDHGFTPDIKHPLHIETVFVHIRQAIAEHHELQVCHIILIKFGTIPRTSCGKIQRHACRRFSGKFPGCDRRMAYNRKQRWHVWCLYCTADCPDNKTTLTGRWERFIAHLWADTSILMQRKSTAFRIFSNWRR